MRKLNFDPLKRSCLIILLLGCFLFVVDKIVIIRIKYDLDGDRGCTIDYNTAGDISVGKGDVNDCPDYCWGYKKGLNDGILFIGFSMDGLRVYSIDDICYVEGIKKKIYYNIIFPKGMIHFFWNANIQVSFDKDDEGGIHSVIKCKASDIIDQQEAGDSIFCDVYK